MRYSALPYPKRAFKPGTGQRHPSQDPEGFQWSLQESFTLHHWRILDYLYAIDLFNAGYYWEAHEVLEAHWKKAERNSLDAHFLRGLIQISAYCLKLDQGKIVPQLLERAYQNWKPLPETHAGIQGTAFLKTLSKLTVPPSQKPLITLV